MAEDEIVVTTTPPDLFKRMDKYPKELDREMKLTMRDSLLVLQENVPPYPKPSGKPQKFKSEKQRRKVFALIGEGQVPYKRTVSGGIGGSLGSSQSGGKSGRPDIFLVRKLGSSNYIGEFGSRLDHAKHVIGTKTQASYHRGTWWVIDDVRKRAQAKIIKLHKELTEDLARFLEGRG